MKEFFTKIKKKGELEPVKHKSCSIMIACSLVFTTLLTGCNMGNSKLEQEKQEKIAKYDSYIEKNPISMEEKLMVAEYSMNGTKTTIKMGMDKAKNSLMNVSVSDAGEVSIYTLNNDSYLFVNLIKNGENAGKWYHTTLSQQEETAELTSSFSDMVSIDDMFEGIKSCKYNKTMTQDNVEYDVLKAIVPLTNKEETSEQGGNGVDVEVVGENERAENEQVIYLYINAETDKLEKIQTSEDGYSIVIKFSDLETLTLPSDITISEKSEEEFMMSFMDGFLQVLANAITPTQTTTPPPAEISNPELLEEIHNN